MVEEVKELEDQEKEEPILDLDELIEPVGHFRLEGQLYDFVQVGSLGLIAQKEIDNWWRKVEEIRKKNKPTAVDEENYGRLIQKLITKVSNLPPEVAKTAKQEKMLQALSVFFSFRTANQLAFVLRMTQLAGIKPENLTGASSSLGSIISGLKETPPSG